MKILFDQSHPSMFTGEHRTDARVHSHPDCVPCSSVDCQIKSTLPRSSLRANPHHPPTHVHDWAPLHRSGNEMCKCVTRCKVNLGKSAEKGAWINSKSNDFYVCLVLQLDADDAKVTFEEEPGQDVYYESQMPL